MVFLFTFPFLSFLIFLKSRVTLTELIRVFRISEYSIFSLMNFSGHSSLCRTPWVVTQTKIGFCDFHFKNVKWESNRIRKTELDLIGKLSLIRAEAGISAKKSMPMRALAPVKRRFTSHSL